METIWSLSKSQSKENEKRISLAHYVTDSRINTYAKFLFDVDKNVLEDKEVILDLKTYISDDNLKWKFYAGCKYIGGIHKMLDSKEGTSAPGFRVSAKELEGKYIKTELSCNKTLVAGVRIELWP